MTTDNRTGEPSEAQIEAAAKVLFAIEEPDLNDWRWNRENPYTPNDPHGWRKYWLDAARAALVAAAGAAPQAESEPGKRLSPEFCSDLVGAARERIQAVWADVPGGVDAETLAQNVVSAQEFFWLAHAFPAVQQVRESDLFDENTKLLLKLARIDELPQLGIEADDGSTMFVIDAAEVAAALGLTAGQEMGEHE